MGWSRFGFTGVPSGKWLVVSQNDISWRCMQLDSYNGCHNFSVINSNSSNSVFTNCLFTLRSALPRKGGEAHCERCSLIGWMVSIPARYWTPIGLPLPGFKLRRFVFSSFSRSSHTQSWKTWQVCSRTSWSNQHLPAWLYISFFSRKK